jgi:hypothetical protein
MKPILVEKLPANKALYKVVLDKNILPGQWLSAGHEHFPVFKSSNQETLFLADENVQLPSKFIISGEAIVLPDENRKLLLLADGRANLLLLFLINHLRVQWGDSKLRNRLHLILMGSRSVFPFQLVPSSFLLPDIPAGVIANAQLLEDLELPARLACTCDLPGCYSGTLSKMLRHLNFKKFLESESLIVAIGSKDLLATTKKLFNEQATKQFLINFDY